MLTGADDSVVRPHRNPSPLPLLEDLGVGLFDQRTNTGRASHPANHRAPRSSHDQLNGELVSISPLEPLVSSVMIVAAFVSVASVSALGFSSNRTGLHLQLQQDEFIGWLARRESDKDVDDPRSDVARWFVLSESHFTKYASAGDLGPWKAPCRNKPLRKAPTLSRICCPQRLAIGVPTPPTAARGRGSLR